MTITTTIEALQKRAEQAEAERDRLREINRQTLDAHAAALDVITSLRAELAELHRAVWVPQDDQGTLYCALCEQRYPDHYHSCRFDAPAGAGHGEEE